MSPSKIVPAVRRWCVVAAASLPLSCAAMAEPPPPRAPPAPPAPDAQAPPPAERAEPTDPLQIQQELIRIQQRLVAAEQKAMQDPAMQKMQADLQEQVEREVAKVEPKFDQKVARLGEIQGNLARAQEAGDQVKMQQLVAEGTQLQQELEAAQTKVIEGEEMSAAIDAFQQKLHERMLEVEPETDVLIARANVLVTQLERLSAPPPGP